MKDQKTYKIIGAAMEVPMGLGCGFLEVVYHEALVREFQEQDIPFKSQPIVNIQYKGKSLNKTYVPDFICFDDVIVEIKALKNLTGLEESQMINYLKASKIEIGLLLNFGSKSLEYNRFVYSI